MTFIKTKEQTEVYVSRLADLFFVRTNEYFGGAYTRQMRLAEDIAIKHNLYLPQSKQNCLNLFIFYLQSVQNVDTHAIKREVRYPYYNDPEVVSIRKHRNVMDHYNDNPKYPKGKPKSKRKKRGR